VTSTLNSLKMFSDFDAPHATIHFADLITRIK
jgi:hypothetical protein